MTVRAAFDFVSAVDSSCHTVEMYGEAIDASDKATNKAMSAAYKYAALQTFCIPTQGDNDADRQSPRVRHDPIDPTPVQGWSQWTVDIGDVVVGCETDEALTRLQNTHRATLRVLAGAEPKLYENLGARILERRRFLGSFKSNAVPTDATNADGARSVVASARKPRARKVEGAKVLPARLNRNSGRARQSRECPAHRAWVRGHACSIPGCAEQEIEAAHVRNGTDGAMALKPSDRWVISLCRYHHAEQHRIGEVSFSSAYKVDLIYKNAGRGVFPTIAASIKDAVTSSYCGVLPRKLNRVRESSRIEYHRNIFANSKKMLGFACAHVEPACR